MDAVLKLYVGRLKELYGHFLVSVILYGSYARGDFRSDSDIDIMILLNMDEWQIKGYRHALSYMTYDFNMEYDLDIKPIAKSVSVFQKWVDVYAFYSEIQREGVQLYHAA